MIDVARRISLLKYLFGVYPSVWQLPNAVKILEFNELTKVFSPDEGTKVLDLGCGKGLQTQLLASRGAKVFGVEPNEKRYKLAQREVRWSRAKRDVSFFHGTLDQAPFEDGSFDSVVSFCVLEHIPNLDEVLQRLHRLLRKGGQLHATVDSLSNIEDNDLIEKHRNEHSVVEYFTPQTVDDRLRGAGFEVLEKRHILTSDMAKQMLVNELKTGNYWMPPDVRSKYYSELVEAETQAPSETGTMILVRAQKAEA